MVPYPTSPARGPSGSLLLLVGAVDGGAFVVAAALFLWLRRGRRPPGAPAMGPAVRQFP
jgi:hypothetical protein